MSLEWGDDFPIMKERKLKMPRRKSATAHTPLNQRSKSDLMTRVFELEIKNLHLRRWVNDLQSEMYVNCVYCGHRYGPNPGTPVAMADVLKRHIEKCPDHPMSKLKAAIKAVRKTLADLDR